MLLLLYLGLLNNSNRIGLRKILLRYLLRLLGQLLDSYVGVRSGEDDRLLFGLRWLVRRLLHGVLRGLGHELHVMLLGLWCNLLLLCRNLLLLLGHCHLNMLGLGLLLLVSLDRNMNLYCGS